MVIFNFDKNTVISQLIQFGYDLLFSCACSSIAVAVITLLVDTQVSWKPLWLAITAAIMLITYLYRCIMHTIYPQAEADEGYAEEPIYAYNNYYNEYAAVEKIIYTDPNHKTAISKFSFVDKSGKFITEKWYDSVSSFFDNGVAIVYNGELQKYNIIDGRGIELMADWVDNIESFENNVAKVYRKAYRVIRNSDVDETQRVDMYVEYTEINYVTPSGILLWDNWKDAI